MNESYAIVYSPKAKDDLKEIYSYIALVLLVPGTAESQVSRIRKTIRSLDCMPLRYPVVDWEPWKSMGMHKMSVDNFVIFYIADNENLVVTIIRIVYEGRDIAGITE